MVLKRKQIFCQVMTETFNEVIEQGSVKAILNFSKLQFSSLDFDTATKVGDCVRR